jgi:urease gamma subunit
MTKAKLQDFEQKQSLFPSASEIKDKVKQNQALKRNREDELKLVLDFFVLDAIPKLKLVLEDIQLGTSTVQKWQYSKRIPVILDDAQIEEVRAKLSELLVGYELSVSRKFEEYTLLVKWD